MVGRDREITFQVRAYLPEEAKAIIVPGQTLYQMLERIPLRERRDLLIAWLAISIAFTLIYIRGGVNVAGFIFRIGDCVRRVQAARYRKRPILLARLHFRW